MVGPHAVDAKTLMTPIPLLARIAVVASAALMLCAPALWNGLPFFYPDTPTYLRGAQLVADRLTPALTPAFGLVAQAATATEVKHMTPETPMMPMKSPPTTRGLTSLDDKVVLAGRSVYYGALLYGAQRAGSLWVAVGIQALCLAAVLYLLMVRLWRVRPALFLGTVGVLTLATPLAVYADLLMPDVFAGVAILAFAALCVYWRQLAGVERGLLAGVLLFGLMAHASHVAVIAVLLGVALALRRWNARWQGLSATALAVGGVCLTLAVGAEWAFAQGVQRAVGAAPLRLPYTTGRLIEMGPGTEFLRQHCADAAVSGYAVCPLRANYPTTWDAFLFSADPARGTFALVDAATKRRIVSQQWQFIGDVIAHDPWGVLTGWVADLGRQVMGFRVDVWSFGASQLAMFEGRVPAQIFAAMQTSRGWNEPAYNRVLSTVTYASTLAALMLGAWWAWRRRAGAPACVPQRLEQVAGLVIAGVGINALVCATAASALDRFQSRVIWLLPFLALAVLALMWSRRTERRTAA